MRNIELYKALAEHFGVPADSNHIVFSGDGGFFVKGHGFHSYALARRLTGIGIEHPRPRRARIGAYGDYATIAMINGIKS